MSSEEKEQHKTKWNIKTFAYVGVFLALVLISLALLYWIWFVDDTFLFRLVVDYFVNPIAILSILGMILYIGIMGIQGLLVPIPSEIVLLASGMIWGLWIGGILGIIGSMAAGLLCYYISRKGGRPLAEKFVGEKALTLADNLIEKYGWGIIIIARLLPFIAFDPISYASGLVNLDAKKYAIGTLIGSIFRAFFYSWLGSILFADITFPVNWEIFTTEQIDAYSESFNLILFVILGVLVAIFGAYYLFSIYLERKAGIDEAKINSNSSLEDDKEKEKSKEIDSKNIS